MDCNYLDNGAEIIRFCPTVRAASGPDMEGNWLNLPKNIAMKLRNNPEWVLEMHYVNSTDKTVIANAVNLGVLPEEQNQQLRRFCPV